MPGRRSWSPRTAGPLLFLLCLLTTLAFTGVGCRPAGPRVVGFRTFPETAAATVHVDRQVYILFGQPMDEASVEAALRLRPEPPGGYSAELTADGLRLLITPGSPWRPATNYEVLLAASARDAGGRALGRDYQSSFTTSTARTVECHGPRLSPSGTMAAWLEESAGGWQAWLAGLQAGPDPRLIHASIWPGGELAWLDESTILIVAAEADGSVIRPRPALITIADGQVELMALALSQPGRLSFAPSPDASYIVVQNDMYLADAHSDYHRQLILAHRDGSASREIGNLMLGWGTDSSTLFWLDLPGIGEGHSFDYTLHRYDLASGVSTAMPRAARINNLAQAARSPDGQAIVFSDWLAEEVVTADGLEIRRLPRDVWMISTAGDDLRRLTADQGRNTDVEWLGSRALVWSSDRGGDGWDVWSMPEVTEESTQYNLTERAGYDGQPHGSPGGELIVYVSDASGTREVWLMGADGSGRRLLSIR